MGTLTPNRSFPVPTVGGDAGPEFAEEVNAAITYADLACGGSNVLNVGGSANVTLTVNQAQNMIQQFTGILTGNITVFAPAAGAFYAVENATTGNFSLSFGCTGGGNAQVIPAGLSTWLWTDGSFTRLSNPPGWQEIATYTVSGAASQSILLPPPFRRWRCSLLYLQPSASGGAVNAQFSSTGGASAVAGPYSWVSTAVTSSASSVVTFSSTAGTNIPITSGMLVSSVPWDVTFEVSQGNTSFTPVLRGGGFGISNTGPTYLEETFSGTVASSGFGLNALILNATSGTWSGTVIVEGLP